MPLIDKNNAIDFSSTANGYPRFISGTMVFDDDIMEKWVKEESEKISAEINKQILDNIKKKGAEILKKASISHPEPEQPWDILSYLDFPQIYPVVPEHIQRE